MPAAGREPLESPTELPPDIPPDTPREPILTLPGALTAYIVLLAVIHAVRALLPVEWDYWVLEMFAFIPKRYDSTLLAIPLPGGVGAKIWTFLTYSLLHANISHILFNVLWLLPRPRRLTTRCARPSPASTAACCATPPAIWFGQKASLTARR